MANETSDGDTFLTTLKKMRLILERLAEYRIKARAREMLCMYTSAVLQKNSGSETADTKRAQNALYSLAVEYLPKLLSYMSFIKTSKPGGCGLWRSYRIYTVFGAFHTDMGVLLLDILCYLMALEQGSLFSFLSTFSSVLLYLPCPEWPQACQEVVTRLCHFVLPTCLGETTVLE